MQTKVIVLSTENEGVIPFNRCDLPHNSKIIRNKYSVTINEPNNIHERFKVCSDSIRNLCGLQNHIEEISSMLVRMSFQTVISLSATYFQLLLWLWRVHQAFFHSKKLTHDLVTDTASVVNLPPHQLVNVILPQYKLVESISYFFDTYHPPFSEDLKMTAALFHQYSLFRLANNGLSDLAGLYTDDYINTGTVELMNEKQRWQKIIIGKMDQPYIRFLGTVIEKDHLNQSVCISHDLHIENPGYINGSNIDHKRLQTTYCSLPSQDDRTKVKAFNNSAKRCTKKQYNKV